MNSGGSGGRWKCGGWGGDGGWDGGKEETGDKQKGQANDPVKYENIVEMRITF